VAGCLDLAQIFGLMDSQVVSDLMAIWFRTWIPDIAKSIFDKDVKNG